MAIKYNVETFSDIIKAVQEELGQDKNDTEITNRIKRDINAVYLNEVSAAGNWNWLRQKIEVQTVLPFETGTANVTQGSTDVTLTDAPTTSLKGYWFSPTDYDERFKIAQHEANSTSVVLESAFTNESNTEITFKIWTDALPLPADARETYEVTHSYRRTPLEGKGDQKFTQIVTQLPKSEGRPINYTTGGLVDAEPFQTVSGLPATDQRSSSGLTRTVRFAATLGASEETALLAPGDRIEVSTSGSQKYNGRATVATLTTDANTNDTITYVLDERFAETAIADAATTVKKLKATDENTKYRELMIYPAIFDSVTTLYVDYIKEPQPLIEDTDEPLMPVEDRMILVYGALARQWVKVRDEQTAGNNAVLYQNKLTRMLGKLEDSTDLLQLEVGKEYLARKRRQWRLGWRPWRND